MTYNTIKKKIKHLLKLSIYIKKYILEEMDCAKGIYYILKRKGKKRLSIESLQDYQRNLLNESYWHDLINKSKETFYSVEKQYIMKKENYFDLLNNDLELLNRQKFAVANSHGRILDVGCFDGKLITYLFRQGIEGEAIDFCDQFLEIARKNLSSVGGNPSLIKKGLFQKLPYENEIFDSVISQETLEHFFQPETMLSEIQRVLKKGGFFIGSVPLENKIDAVSHIVYYTFNGMKSLLNQYFEVVTYKTMKNRDSDKSENLIIWKVMKKF